MILSKFYLSISNFVNCNKKNVIKKKGEIQKPIKSKNFLPRAFCAFLFF